MPNAVASATASRGFLRGVSDAAAALGFSLIGIFEIEDDRLALVFDHLFFVEDRLGDDVLLAGPIAEVPLPAALAAKREILVHLGIRLSLADGASVLHR